MPRIEHPTTDPDLRDYLLGEFVDFREMCSTTLEGHTIEGGETVWEHLSHRIDALLDGREVTINRYQLPDWHDESPKHGGNPADRFTLGPDDILRPHEPKLRLNRAERRRAGWRGNRLNGAPVDSLIDVSLPTAGAPPDLGLGHQRQKLARTPASIPVACQLV